MRSWLLSALLFCAVIPGFSQSPTLIFKRIDRSGGLPVDNVTCIRRDSSGFTWIGTTDGLFRYDGFSYTEISTQKRGSSDVLSGYISSIYIDKSGFVWVTIHYRGLVILDNEGDIIDVFNSDANAEFKTNRAHRVVMDSKGQHWCSTDDGLFQVAIENRKLKVKQRINLVAAGHSTNMMGQFVFDDKERIWICTFKGLVVFDMRSKRIFNALYNPHKNPLLQDSIASQSIFYGDNGKRIWYSNWEPALKLYNEEKDSLHIIYTGTNSLQPDYSWRVDHFLEDSHKRLWLACGRGLLLADVDKRKIVAGFHNDPKNSNSISSNLVIHIYEDEDSNFWISTTEGINISRPYDERFTNISENVAKQYPFADKEISCVIIPDSNTIFICTYAGDGIYETDHHFNLRKHHSFHEHGYDWVWSYYIDKKRNQVFISTQSGMLLYSIATRTFTKLTKPPFNTFHPVNAFIPGKDGTVWMSRYVNEFMQYDPASGHSTVYKITDLGMIPQIIEIAADKSGNMWIMGNKEGLFCYNPVTKKIIEKLTVEKNTSNGLKQVEVIYFKDLGNHLFIGYDQMGFSIYDKNKKRFRHYNRSEGLSGNRVSDMLIMNNKNLWLATSNGFTDFNLATNELLTYNFDHGILNNNINKLTLTPGGKIIAATTKGIVTFDPEAVSQSTKLAPPQLTEVMLYGKKLNTNNLPANEPLLVSYDENYISLNFISLHYALQHRVEYAYLLEGFDKKWMYAGNRRYTSYTNLPGGDYTFKVRARLPGGNWVENAKPLNVRVTTAFYRKWYFIAFCAITFAVVVFGISRYRLKQVIRLEKMRAAISSDLHDEVGASLTSISIFSEMAKQSLPVDAKALQHLKRIGERSRESIEKMSDIIWSINPENDSMQQILIRMRSFMNEILEGKDIEVHWTESEEISSLRCGMMQRKNFYLLFKEAAINIVKYADAKNIFVQVAVDNKTVLLHLCDDGIGFDHESVKMGNGIKNIKQRALHLKGNAIITSEPGKGTKVLIRFPA